MITSVFSLDMLSFFCFFFFFSSRRRHTRLVSDWSSDVCSSDLLRTAEPAPRAVLRAGSSRSPPSPQPPHLAHGSEEHTSELQSLTNLVCRLLLEKKKLEHKTLASESHLP